MTRKTEAQLYADIAEAHEVLVDAHKVLAEMHRQLADIVATDPFPPPQEGHLLDIPYFSQWDIPDADDRPGDCGPACVCSIVHLFTTFRPTVDDVATRAGQATTGTGKWYTNHSQLRVAASSYGVALASRSPAGAIRIPLTVEEIESEIRAGRPVIALVNYGVLDDMTGGNQDSFRGGHWVLVVGYNDRHFFVHDPDFKGSRRHEGRNRALPRVAFVRALSTTAQTAGNNFNNQGLVVR
jgi:hypothetical protein